MNLDRRWTMAGNVCFRCLAMTALCFDLAVNIWELRPSSLNRPITCLSFFTRYMSGTAFLAIIVGNRKKMADLLPVFLKRVTPDQEASLRRHAMTGVAVFAVARVIDLVALGVHLTSFQPDLLHVISDASNAIRDTIPWFFGGCFMCTFFVKAIRFSEGNYYARLSQRLSHSCSPDDASPDAHTLAHERRLLDRQRDQLMASLSFLPLLWFADTFIVASADIMDAMDTENEVSERLVSLLPLACQSLVIMHLLLQCDSAAALVRDTAADLIAALNAHPKGQQLEPLRRQLKASLSFQLTAWAMFDMNRKFVLSFTSALITFTVLFIQLAKGITAK